MDTVVAQSKLDDIHDLDGDIVRNVTEMIKVLNMNPDTIKMYGEILAYVHNGENDEDNIDWAGDMITSIHDQLEERKKLYQDFANLLSR